MIEYKLKINLKEMNNFEFSTRDRVNKIMEYLGYEVFRFYSDEDQNYFYYRQNKLTRQRNAFSVDNGVDTTNLKLEEIINFDEQKRLLIEIEKELKERAYVKAYEDVIESLTKWELYNKLGFIL